VSVQQDRQHAAELMLVAWRQTKQRAVDPAQRIFKQLQSSCLG